MEEWRGGWARQGIGNRVDAFWHAVLAHEFEAGELVLLVDELLPLNQHRCQGRDALDLLLGPVWTNGGL